MVIPDSGEPLPTAPVRSEKEPREPTQPARIRQVPCRQPCPTCPWRVDQHADEIPNFKLDLAERLVSTTDDQFGAPVFACHQSQDQKEVVCVGWLWRYGWDSIAIRLKLMREEMRPEELEMPPDWDDRLHRTFDEVITKLRRDTVEDGAGAQ